MSDRSLPIDDGFEPIVGHYPRFLILGSMPGSKSLSEQQYYAHPRNAFWPIMAAMFNFDHTQDYQQRCAILTQSDVAVWDVLKSCHRPGSLDSDINDVTMVINDFRTFLQQHDSIAVLFFNGAKAENIFKQVLPTLTDAQRSAITMRRLPSSSPAHAAMTFEQKLISWRSAFSSAPHSS